MLPLPPHVNELLASGSNIESTINAFSNLYVTTILSDKTPESYAQLADGMKSVYHNPPLGISCVRQVGYKTNDEPHVVDEMGRHIIPDKEIVSYHLSMEGTFLFVYKTADAHKRYYSPEDSVFSFFRRKLIIFSSSKDDFDYLSTMVQIL